MAPAYLSLGPISQSLSAPGSPVNVIIVGIGESGMTGYGGTGTDVSALPGDYPPASGLISIDDNWEMHDPIINPCEQVGVAIMDGLNDTVVLPVGDGSWGPLYAWELQKALPSGSRVVYVPCGRAGSPRSLWADISWGPGGTSKPFTNAALLALEAEKKARQLFPDETWVLGAILLDQGINDANAGLAAGWAAAWTTIETAFRKQFFATQAPVVVRNFPSIGMDNATTVQRDLLIAEVASWANGTTPKRIIVDTATYQFTDDPPKTHLTNTAQYDQALAALSASLSEVQAVIALGKPQKPAGGGIRGWKLPSPLTARTRTKLTDSAGGPNLNPSGGGAVYGLVTINVQALTTNIYTVMSRGVGGGNGYLFQVESGSNLVASFRARVQNGSGAGIVVNSPAIAAGDITKVMPFVLWHDGSTLKLRLSKVDGATAACVGFTAHATQWFQLGYGSGTQPDITFWGVGSCTGAPTNAEMDAWADDCETAGLCVPMTGVGITASHVNNLWTEGDVSEDEIGTDNLMVTGSGKTSVFNAAPVWTI